MTNLYCQKLKAARLWQRHRVLLPIGSLGRCLILLGRVHK